MSATPAELMVDAIRILLGRFTIAELGAQTGQEELRYNGPDFQTLHFIGANSGCKSAALAAFLGVAPTTAQSIVDRLLKRGVISRGPHPNSKRAVALTLTLQGETMRVAIEARDRENCEAMLTALPVESQGQFVDQLRQIAKGIDQTGAR